MQTADQADDAGVATTTTEGARVASLEALPEPSLLFRLLLALPPEVLQHILRRAGRHCRRACRALLAAYGPLDGSLKVPSGQVLPGSWERLRNVATLELHWEKEPAPDSDSESESGSEAESESTPDSELMTRVAQGLPSLQSLTLMSPLRGADLALLAPLAPTLTALGVELEDAGTKSPRALQQLTRLRSLTLTGGQRPAAATMPAWQRALGSLPHLVHLSWFDGPWAHWVSGLSQLTSLSISVGVSRDDPNLWDAASVAAVRDDLSRLKSLSVRLHNKPFDCRAAVDLAYVSAMIEGLAGCSGLEAVHINERDVTWCLGQLSRLQSLASLTLCTWSRSLLWLSGPLMAALQPLTNLTKLDVLGHNLPREGPPYSWLPLSLVELRIGSRYWAPSLMLPRLCNLPALRKLDLGDPGTLPTSYWTPEAAEQLTALTQLTSLAVLALNTPPPHFVRNLCGLTALRELRLHVHIDDTWERYDPPPAYTLCEMTDEDLLHLAPLGQHLTHLELGHLVDVSGPGVVALLGALTNLQQLKMSWLQRKSSKRQAWDGGVLVQGLLPLLAHLTSLCCEGLELQHASCAVLRAAAAAHECRCELRV